LNILLSTKIEHALEFTDLRAVQFQLIVHEVSVQQCGPSDIFLKMIHGPKRLDSH